MDVRQVTKLLLWWVEQVQSGAWALSINDLLADSKVTGLRNYGSARAADLT